MFYDYHMHSNFSNDSKADMEDMIKRSIDLGLKEICFTDHVDYDLIVLFPETLSIRSKEISSLSGR